VTGTPAPGFVVGAITTEPSVVLVTGEKAIVDNLQAPLLLEPHDVTGATSDITQTKEIVRPANVSTDRQTVVLRIEIRPVFCGDEQEAPCGPATLQVAPTFADVPAGLVVVGGPYTVTVVVSGPLEELAGLQPSDLAATISLEGATAGVASYTASVTAPAGITVDSVEPVAVTLATAAAP
jgi:hypothetical protein